MYIGLPVTFITLKTARTAKC